jgi:hypothetical protein
MAGGNWHHVQHINPINGRIEFPKGPLVLAAGETPKWVDAWVVQASTGSAGTYYGSDASDAFDVANEWTANVRLYSRGKFRPGPAVGIALLYTKDGTGANKYFWWSADPIELQYAP